MAAFEKKLDAMLGMTAEELDAIGDAYDNDQIEFTEADTVYDGSPLDYIGSKRETFIVEGADYAGVRQAMRMTGCSKSDVYRTALRQYLDSLNLTHA